jgi:hypothetical protein
MVSCKCTRLSLKDHFRKPTVWFVYVCRNRACATIDFISSDSQRVQVQRDWKRKRRPEKVWLCSSLSLICPFVRDLFIWAWLGHSCATCPLVCDLSIRVRLVHSCATCPFVLDPRLTCPLAQSLVRSSFVKNLYISRTFLSDASFCAWPVYSIHTQSLLAL